LEELFSVTIKQAGSAGLAKGMAALALSKNISGNHSHAGYSLWPIKRQYRRKPSKYEKRTPQFEGFAVIQ
jgi:hypothetical protein